MKNHRISIVIFILTLIALWPIHITSHAAESTAGPMAPWYLSIQYLGLTYHPDGGTTPEVYTLKVDPKAYLVLDVGAAAKLDYRLNDGCFIRFTAGLYQDCAFVSAGCLHAGPRLQYCWRGNSVNIGIGPLFSFRQGWHRFKQYQNNDFYGDRVSHGWQYRFYATALELEYLRRINDCMEFQWSIIPSAPLVITSMFGVRFTFN
jgi:hypothetical protein